MILRVLPFSSISTRIASLVACSLVAIISVFFVLNPESVKAAAGPAFAPGTPLSPLKCLSPQFFSAGQTQGGASVSDLCAPQSIGAKINIFAGSRTNGETITLKDTGSLGRNKDCTKRTFGFCRRYEYRLTHSYKWVQTPAEGGPIVTPGEQPRIEWTCQPHQEVGWMRSEGSGFGFWTESELDFVKETYANTTTGLWKSWAGAGTFTAGGLQGSVSLVAPNDTTEYSLTCRVNTSASTITTVGTVYVDRPVLSLSGTPASVGVGESSTLRWEAHNVKKGSCSLASEDASGQNVQPLASALNTTVEIGTQSTGSLFQSTIYRLTCQRYSNAQVSVTATVNVNGTISLTAPRNTTIENGRSSEYGIFRATRTGSTTAAITIPFTLEGTGARGTDYTLGGGVRGSNGTTLSFGRNVSSVDVTVQPRRNNNRTEGDKTVTMVLSNHPFPRATVTVQDDEVAAPPPVIIPPAVPPQLAEFYANPPRVEKGERATIHWTIHGVVAGTTCSVRPAPAGGTLLTLSGTGTITGSQQTAPVAGESIYTLSCGLTGSLIADVSRTLKVMLIPSYQEI